MKKACSRPEKISIRVIFEYIFILKYLYMYTNAFVLTSMKKKVCAYQVPADFDKGSKKKIFV